MEEGVGDAHESSIHPEVLENQNPEVFSSVFSSGNIPIIAHYFLS